MKNLKKALVASAVLAGLAGNAYAGTEACFEVYSQADDTAIADWATLYNSSTCVVDGNLAAGTATLGAPVVGKIAYELTKDLSVPFDDLDGTGAITGKDLQIVYVPTSDIPPGTLIEMKLDGATFAGNANQLHLMKMTAGTPDEFKAVASSDGTFDGTTTVKFITKGEIIGAGTRLALSQVNTVTADTEVQPISVHLANTECTESTTQRSVTITATTAVTDGGTGYSIIGAISKANKVLDISAQFVAFNDAQTVSGDVNAETGAGGVVARTQFVYTADSLTLQSNQVIFPGEFYNRGAILDRAYKYNGAAAAGAKQTFDPSDDFNQSFVSTIEPGATVKMVTYDTQATPSGVLSDPLDTVAYTIAPTNATVYDVDAVDFFNGTDVNPAAADSYLFGADFQKAFYAVENTDADGIMNFNYNVNVKSQLKFNDTDMLDYCEQDINTHKIGVNGAVLKVPYVTNAQGNFVRITNEHNKEAEVTVDIFGESVDGTTGKREAVAVQLGRVPAKSSVVYFVPDLINKAIEDKGYTGQDGGYAANGLGVNGVSNAARHTMTFTVTSPKNTVHGVSVQKVATGDRVMPVLDQNEWAQ